MPTTELIRIERKKLVRAPRARVWQALTNIEHFSKWFQVEAKGAFQPGARVEMVSTHKEHKGIEWFVIVDEVKAEHKFSWRWHPGAVKPVDAKEPMTLVEFFLEEVEEGTIVTVVESGFDRIAMERRAKAFEDNSKGWEIQLESLSAYVPKAA